jgi:hypothetical protein
VTEDIKSSENNIEVTRGILNFKDRESLYLEIEKLNNLNRESLINWEQSKLFLSQESIYYQINDAEIILESELYSDYDENLSISELESLGVKVCHSSIYNKYLQSGLITETIADDGSMSFELSVLNPAMAVVLNIDGLVIVNDTIYQYNKNSVKILTDGDVNRLNELIDSKVTDKERDIIVLDYSYQSKSSHSWSKYSGWKYNGSNKRYCLNIYGYSTNSSTLLHSIYYVESKGQKKKWGSWKYRNDYNPIYRISGNWQFHYIVTINGVNQTWSSIWDNDYKSPWSHTYYGGNHTKVNLSPNGYWDWSSGSNTFFDAIDVYYFRFHGHFYGGSSGYHIYLNRG